MAVKPSILGWRSIHEKIAITVIERFPLPA